jgi:putative tryptophan/tyrosine transport system substrate-binding protein
MRLIGLAVGLAVSLTLAPLANAQQAWQIPRIGFLRTAAPPESYIEAFRQGLKERGYIEGKNIAFEYRWGGGRTDQLPELAAELVRLKVDVVVVEGVPPALAARKASITIPIVMASSGDPVGTGLIVSLARPGGNISGLTSINAQLGWKNSGASQRGCSEPHSCRRLGTGGQSSSRPLSKEHGGSGPSVGIKTYIPEVSRTEQLRAWRIRVAT